MYAHDIAMRIAMQEGLFYLDRNDHPNMIVGQATLGAEIFEQQKIKLKEEDEELQIDTVILPTMFNGCGLTMGVAMAIKKWHPHVLVFEVLYEEQNSLIQNGRTLRCWSKRAKSRNCKKG